MHENHIHTSHHITQYFVLYYHLLLNRVEVSYFYVFCFLFFVLNITGNEHGFRKKKNVL